MTTANGGLSRPLLASDYHVPPEVRLDSVGAFLIWTADDTPWRPIRAAAGLLDAFLGLRSAKPADVQRFAVRWGVLGLCQHGRPASHRPNTLEEAPCTPVGRSVRGGRAFEVREPVSGWVAMAARAYAVVAIAAELRNDRTAGPDLWTAAIGAEAVEREGYALPRRDLEAQRRAVAAHVSMWLDEAWIRPRLVWWRERGGFWLRPELDTMYAALALQLALAVAGAEELVRCDNCGDAYLPPGRRPRADKRAYCPNCQAKGAPQREANRTYKAKLKARARVTRRKP